MGVEFGDGVEDSGFEEVLQNFFSTGFRDLAQEPIEIGTQPEPTDDELATAIGTLLIAAAYKLGKTAIDGHVSVIVDFNPRNGDPNYVNVVEWTSDPAEFEAGVDSV